MPSTDYKKALELDGSQEAARRALVVSGSSPVTDDSLNNMKCVCVFETHVRVHGMYIMMHAKLVCVLLPSPYTVPSRENQRTKRKVKR